MSEPEAEPMPSLMRQRRALRRSTIIWSVALVSQVLLAVANWVTLAVDGGGKEYTWGMAIAGTIGAAASVTILLSVRQMTRRVRERAASRAQARLRRSRSAA